MPERHVALLRGINVGAAKRVPMAELRAPTAARRPAARALRDFVTARNRATVEKLAALL